MKIAKRFLSSVLVFCMCLSLIPAITPIASAVESTGNTTFDNFISDSRWQNGVSYSSGRSPHISPFGSVGCCAYVADFAKFCYGKDNPTSGTYFNNVSEIRAGDILHITQSSGQHWIAVLKRDGNRLYTAEGAYAQKARVGWEGYTLNENSISDKWTGTWYLSDGYHHSSPQPVHTHNLSNYVCPTDGYYEPLSETSINGSQQSYIVSAGTYIYSGPYTQCGGSRWLSANTPLTCVASVTNKAGQRWYKLGGSYNGKWIRANNATYHPASDLSMYLGIRDNPMTEGKENAVTGSVRASYYTMRIKAYLDGLLYFSSTASGGSLIFPYSEITSRVGFESLSPGTHTITVSATDDGGGSVSKSVQFTVEAAVAKPYISKVETIGGDPRTNEPGGKMITLACATGGAAIYYTLDGTEPTQASTRYSFPFKVMESSTLRVRAFLNDKQSAVFSDEIRINNAQAPVITTEDVPEGTRVSISSEANALIYYRAEGVTDQYVIYKKPFILTRDVTVFAYARKSGCKDSEYVSSDVRVKAPETPEFLSPATNAKYAQNSTVTFKWNRISNAAEYTVNVYLNDGLLKTLTVTEPNASICLEMPGTYAVSVTARNAIGSSAEGEKVTAVSVAPLTVRYEDWDGSVISEQIVDYGGDAVEPAEDPERRGYFFLYWNGNPNNITQDTVISAVYRIRSYDVVFYDPNGNLLGYRQTVEYGGHAEVPYYPVDNLPTGYQFLGWNIQASDADSKCDYNYVDSDMKITAVVGWFNQELPLVTKITSATRDDNSYSEITSGSGNYHVAVTVTNCPTAYTTALLRVSLKTAEGKMVKTEARTIGLGPSESGSYELVLNYSGTATQVEAVALGYEGDYKTGSALSQACTSTVQVKSGTIFSDWTNWSPDVPSPQAGRVIEEKTQYRYQKKEYTSSSSSYLAGWTQYSSSRSSWGAWSGWLDYQITETNSRQVQTQEAVSGYNMISYCVSGPNGRSYQPVLTYPLRLQHGPYWWSKAQLDSARVFPVGSYFNYAGNVAGYVLGPGTAYCKWDGSETGGYVPMFIQSTTYKTQWRYRDAVYTYYFYKWSDFTEWQDEQVAISSTVNVETRPMYRYKDQDVPVYDNLTGAEDNSGETYTFDGTLPVGGGTDLNGKIATVMVYKGKNSDPNESQLQYVGQTTIGAGNTYNIAFKPKDEPTIASGDYIVSLGLQGATGLVNIGMIDAPKPAYTVNFYSESELIDSQTVKEGGNAVLPAAPQREGYRFVAWSETGRNVHGDLSISAIYTPITCAVAFVDWINGTATPFALEYGANLSEIAAGMAPEADGYTFQYWDAIHDGKTTVTENMIISAVYEAKTFTVNFYDGNGADKQIIATQTVKYGQAAELPEDPVYSDKIFLGWSTDKTWWDVRTDLDVYPVVIYGETAAVPVSDVGTYYYGMQDYVTLRAADGAKIYYTMDGSDPVPGENAILYTGPIALHGESVVIKAIAVEDNKNSSEVVDVFFDYNEGSDYEVINDKTVVQQYSPIVAGGNSLTLNLKIKNNPGLEGFLFFVECDPSVYYMDYSENTGYDYQAGALTENGTYFVMPDESGWRVLWFNTEAASGDGTLFTLKLKVADNVTSGSYPVSISYSAENMITSVGDDEFDAEFEGMISGATVVGDINGDGDVTLADVILIAKYKAGLYAISELSRLNAADVNCDGSVTLADAVFLARFIIGLETAIPG